MTERTYTFGKTTILLESDPNDKTACVDSLTIKVNGVQVPIRQKYWCGHHWCTLVTPAGTFDIPSCAGDSPAEPTWVPAD